jgi:hypothetical protein
MSRIAFHILASLTAAALSVATAANAGTVRFTLGQQDFADGRAPVFSEEIRQAGVGEAYPFDGTIFGNDLKANLGAFDYTHSIPLVGGGVPVSATLTVGLIDVDSTPDHPLETVAVSFDGITQPGDKFVGISASNSKSSVEVIDIAVPIELLADGELHVNFAAIRAGYGSAGNAIEPDFSTLTVETTDSIVLPPEPNPGPGPHAVPLPPVLMPTGIMLAGLATLPKKRLSRWLRL